jgi:hypothetical protein
LACGAWGESSVEQARKQRSELFAAMLNVEQGGDQRKPAQAHTAEEAVV